MRIVLSIILLSYFFLEKTGQKDTMDSPPEYYVLEWEEGTRLTPHTTDFYIEIDSMGRQDVQILVNEGNVPVLYTADIATPVCADGECKLMNIKFYWTLLGEYAGFDRYPMMPLTKYEHDEFEEKDYQKLHELLKDDKNIIGRNRIDQLVEKPKIRTVNGVDAISGATIARVKESVVSGALYSCFTAWHLVHGKIQDELKANSLQLMDKQMIFEMLYSNNQEYQIFALQNINEINFLEHYEQIARIFVKSTPLVRSIIAKDLTSAYGKTPELQKPFWEAFDLIDSGSKSLLLKYLDSAPKYVGSILSEKLGSMSKNQLKVYFNHITEKEGMSPIIRYNIESFASSYKETYAYLAVEFLMTINN